MEIWDLYDEFGVKTAKQVVRGEKIEQGLYHIIVKIIFRHHDGDFLVMQRDFNKPPFAGYFELSASGAALAGETPLIAAKRELFEETGITTDEFTLLRIDFLKESQYMFHTYLATGDFKKDKVVVQKGETISYQWLSPKDLKEFVSKNNMVGDTIQRNKEYFENIFEKTI